MNDARELTEDAVLKIMEGYGNDSQQLIAVLLDIQAASGRNYVDRQWALLASKILAVPLSKIFDVLTFYAMFSVTPRGEYLIEICQSAPCHFSSGCSGRAQQVVDWFEGAAKIKMGQTSADGKITLARTSCVGACEIGPVAKIGDDVFGDLNGEKVTALVKCCREGNLNQFQNEAPQCQN
ncbi:MAG: NAD(P)H-dependent oxidoreductase subunit E [Treponema sp.]|jgi:NADH-quinone oxidoreductase subunit E|nr:NAD(P)H-dependent oxidoreductase subunit E [Treponema sp.]